MRTVQTWRCVLKLIKYGSEFYFSQWRYLDSKPLISYVLSYYLLSVLVCDCIIMHVWALTFVSCVRLWESAFASLWVCVCVRGCPSPRRLRLCFLLPTELRSLCNKSTFTRLSISFTLCWWESAERLIVFGVLGQHTQISLCASQCVCVCVSVCEWRTRVLKPASPPAFASFCWLFLSLCQSWRYKLFTRHHYIFYTKLTRQLIVKVQKKRCKLQRLLPHILLWAYI